MEKYINRESIPNESLLTKEAESNKKVVCEEALRRIEIGLVSTEKLSPEEQILDYLERVSRVYPRADEVIETLINGKAWKTEPSMVLTIPVVGMGKQEEMVVENSLKKLIQDPNVRSGDVAIMILVNRPLGSISDKTYSKAEEFIRSNNLNGVVLDLDVPGDLGLIAGPLTDEMAILPNEAPIGLLRDAMSIAAMKMWQRAGVSKKPILLQMDGDFEGFESGNFEEVIKRFEDKNTKFLMCTSDWDSEEFPTDSDPALWIGSELMRELPLILKRELNNEMLSATTRNQIVFGEAIQRGIQVPQAERMECVAQKGGYGLLRLKEDELDLNIRMSEKTNCGGVKTSEEVVFKWSNRRAVRSWIDLRQPPISQWVNGFTVLDMVRGISPEKKVSGAQEIEMAVNRTLSRFPIPKNLQGVYKNYWMPILAVLNKYGIVPSQVTEEKKGEDLFFIQIKMG